MSRTDFCRGVVVRLLRFGAAVAALGVSALVARAGPPIDHGAWSSLGGGVGGAGPLQLYVWALETFDDGRGDGPVLYAGGTFATAGGVEVSSLARWDGQAWHSVGGVDLDGAPGRVGSLLVWRQPDGTSVLVVGGEFESVAGVPARNIAVWDGVTWSELGEGLTGPKSAVSDLAVFDDGTGLALYAAGSFTVSGAETVGPGVARFDGRGWSSVGPTLSGDEPTPRLAFFDPDDGGGARLIVGGIKLVSEGKTLGGLAWLDRTRGEGGEWTPLPGIVVGGNNGRVIDLTTAQWQGRPTLFVAGQFFLEGSQEHVAIASLSDGVWSRPGGGFANRTYDPVLGSAVAVLHDGDEPALYSGGFVEIAGGTLARSVARWNGAFWLPLAEGIGMNAALTFNGGNPAFPLAFALDPSVDEPRIVVAGRFLYAGPFAAGCLAAWTPPADPRPGPFNHRDALDIEVLDAEAESIQRFREDTATGEWMVATSSRLLTSSGEVIIDSPVPGAEVLIADATLDGVVAGSLRFSAGSNLAFRVDLRTEQWTIVEGSNGPCNFCGSDAVAPNGLVVGNTYDTRVGGDAMFLADGETVELISPPLDGKSSVPRDVTDDGVVVGSVFIKDVGYVPFMGGRAPFQVLPVPPGYFFIDAIRIASDGSIIGNRQQISPSAQDAVRWAPDGQSFEFLTPLEAIGGTQALDVGPDSIVLGTSSANGRKEFVRWIDGTPQRLRWQIPWTDAWRLASMTAMATSGRLAGRWYIGGLEPEGPTFEERIALFRDRAVAIGDIDGDGRVNDYDLGLVLVEWGRLDSSADVDGNGTVDGADLGAVLADWTGE